MTPGTHWALWSLRISTVLYYLIIIACLAAAFFLPPDPEFFSSAFLILLAIFTLPFVIFLELLIAHLKRRKFWAWVAGIVVGGLYAPSLFLPLGVFILIGLLSEKSREEFMTRK